MAAIGKCGVTIAILVFTGILLSFGFIWMMSRCARGMAYAGIALLLVMLFGGGAVLLAAAGSATDPDAKSSNQAVGVVLLILGALFLCALWCRRNSLEIAIAVVDAAADFLIATKRIILVSIFYFFVSFLCFLIWIVAEFSMLGMNEFKKGTGPQEKVIVWDSAAQTLMIINAFFILWLLVLIDDKKKYIAMVSAATYYFSSNAEADGSASVMTGFRFAYMKNLGSLCFGSLVVTLISILKAMVDALAEGAKEDGDGAAKLVACIAQCCVGCLEACIEYLTKLGYAYMAVTGETYCSSAWNGFLLNLKHCSKFYFAQSIAGMFVFMGILTVTFTNVGIGYLLVNHVTQEADDVGEGTSLAGPYLVFFLLSAIIPTVCLGLFDEAVVTTLQCYGVDCDLNGGEPKFGPKSYHAKLRKLRGEDEDKEDFDDLGGKAGGRAATGVVGSTNNAMV